MDFARRAYVIRRFIQLQGLELLPLGALFLASCAHGLGWFRLPGEGQRLNSERWFFGGLAVVFAATLWSRAWYRKRYSIAKQRGEDSAAGPILMVTAALVGAGWLQQAAHVPFSLPGVLLATALAVVGIGDYPLRRHYLAAAALLMAFVASGPLGVAPAVRSVLFDATIGAALVIVGVGDHLLIVTTLDDPAALQEVHAGV